LSPEPSTGELFMTSTPTDASSSKDSTVADSLRPRIALVTGAGGLLGRCVAQRLIGAGWQVDARDHTRLDITREADVRSAVEQTGPAVIINCAAMTNVDRCEEEPEWAFSVNEYGAGLLAQAASDIGAGIAHISTDYVFDGEKEGFYTQEDETRPLSVYAESKLGGEVAVCEAARQSYIVRSSWIFGPRGKNFGSRVVELARAGKPLKGVVDQVSIPTYAPDLAERIVEILEMGGPPGVYQVTNTGPATWHEFALVALKLAGLGETPVERVTRAQLGQPAARPKNSAMRCLLSEKLGLPALRHWRDSLREFIDRQ
jgi:dTDP-4-dehydrorhamnose reductase